MGRYPFVDECPLCGGIVWVVEHSIGYCFCCAMCGYGTKVRWRFVAAEKEWAWLREMAKTGIRYREKFAEVSHD